MSVKIIRNWLTGDSLMDKVKHCSCHNTNHAQVLPWRTIKRQSWHKQVLAVVRVRADVYWSSRLGAVAVVAQIGRARSVERLESWVINHIVEHRRNFFAASHKSINLSWWILRGNEINLI